MNATVAAAAPVAANDAAVSAAADDDDAGEYRKPFSNTSLCTNFAHHVRRRTHARIFLTGFAYGADCQKMCPYVGGGCADVTERQY